VKEGVDLRQHPTLEAASAPTKVGEMKKDLLN
jgi:hypothetical protein